MKDRYLIDTDVLIDYFKDNPKAIEFLESPEITILISSITVAELFAGVRDGHEREKIENFISAFEFLPLTLEISRMGGLLKRDYGKSHGLGLADSLIAASSIISESTLVTLNIKHFKMIKNVKLPYSKS
jgi:predicted nucleic acid-binding protein